MEKIGKQDISNLKFMIYIHQKLSYPMYFDK